MRNNSIVPYLFPFLLIGFLLGTQACKNNNLRSGETRSGVAFFPSFISFLGYSQNASAQVRVSNFEDAQLVVDSIRISDPGYSIKDVSQLDTIPPLGTIFLEILLDYARFDGTDTASIQLFINNPLITDKVELLIKGPKKAITRPVSQNEFNDVPIDFSPDESQILFISNQEGAEQVYLMNRDGSNRRRINTQPGHYGVAGFSGDGNKIVYYAKQDTTTTIFMFDLTTQTEQIILRFQGYNIPVAVSEDGQKIVFNKRVGLQHDVYLMDLQATGFVPLATSEVDERAVFFEPGDQRVLYYETVQNISQMYKVRVTGSDRRKVSDGVGHDIPRATTEDGEKILFFSDRLNRRDVYISDWDGANVTQVTVNVRYDYPGDINSRIKKVLYLSQINGNNEIFESNYDGTNELRLTEDSRLDFPVAYSKSGSFILFYRAETTNQMYVIDMRSLR